MGTANEVGPRTKTDCRDDGLDFVDVTLGGREAGMTGKPIQLNRTRANWEEFNLKLKVFVGAALGAARARDGADGGAERRGSGHRGPGGRQH